MLRATLGAAAAVGIAGVGLSPSSASAGSSVTGRKPRGPEIPVVPGMSGDPRANEFWYQYDEVFAFNRPVDVNDALTAARNAVGGSLFNIYTTFVSTRAAGTFDTAFKEFVEPAREPLAFLSAKELELYDAYYNCDPIGLTKAYADFGQGILFDPRRKDGLKVHMMNTSPGNPPQAYHIWHGILRARIVLGIDAHRWRTIAPLNGLAWALQSIAKPVTDALNPALPHGVVLRETLKWLTMSTSRLDAQFDSVPYPPGIS